MEFSTRSLDAARVKTGCLVLGAHLAAGEDGSRGEAHLTRRAIAADRATGGALRRAIASGDLAPRAGATLVLRGVHGLAAERVLIVNLGERSAFGESAWIGAVRAAAIALKDLGARDAVLALLDARVPKRTPAWNARHAVLAMREAFYRFDELKTSRKAAAPALVAVTLAAEGPLPAIARAVVEASATADGSDLARRLGNLPANICTPAFLAGEAQKVAAQWKLGCEVLGPAEIAKLGMGAFLAVTRGSREEPRLIVLRYAGGARKAKPVVLVGKGITFDTGGISLKPAGEMDEMKFDMSGAGAVLGTMRALAGMKAPVNAIGLVAACENMPGGSATRPGDVVTTLSGQTVEILNTDAEGRLILCDALTYARRFDPAAVVDIATLTGACVIALGHVASGLFANDRRLARSLVTAGDDAWDRVWELPLWSDYAEQLRSNFADFANIGGRPAGSITAACYLAKFADGLRWAHLDIAGTAWKSGRDKGSTGRPVPLLVRYLLAQASRA